MKDFLNVGFIILTLTCHLVTGEESTEASFSTGTQNLTSAELVNEDNSSSNSSADPSSSVSVTESSTNGTTTLIDPGESNSISPVNNEALTGNGGNGSTIYSPTSSPSTTTVNVASTTATAIKTTSPATTTTITTSTVSSSQPTTSTTVTTTESASSSSPETLPSSTETPTVTTRTDTSEDISTTYSTTENTASTVTPETTTQMSADTKSSSSSQTQPDPTTTLSPVEPSAESTTGGISENTPDQKSSETEPVTENRTLSTESPGELPESANATTAERIAETTQRPKTTSPSESSEGPTTSISQSGCISTSELNTILVVAVIVGVNILSVVVTAFCVHRLVSKKLSWDPPPMHYSKRRSAGNHPVPAPRGTTTGRHLATDVECRAGETPATQIPIVITNEDGWCVPYSDQDKKKKNSVDNNTEDTGV